MIKNDDKCILLNVIMYGIRYNCISVLGIVPAMQYRLREIVFSTADAVCLINRACTPAPVTTSIGFCTRSDQLENESVATKHSI